MEQQILNLIFGHTNMKRITLKLIFVLIFIIGNLNISNCQQTRFVQTGESVELFSDRNLYIAGEEVLFSAYIQPADGQNNSEYSSVLYCEIVTPGGDRIAGNKYLIENSSASGSITIPGDIITGIYYLRAYTKLMRNEGPSFYNYTMLKIVNPGRSEVQVVSDNNNSSDILSAEEEPAESGFPFLISIGKNQYATRDTVNLLIETTGKDQSSWKVLSIAVVPEFSISAEKVKIPENGQSENELYFVSENRGLSITGRLNDNNTGNPLPGSMVNLSIMGSGRDFMAMQTDKMGRFYFSLPDYTGYRDVFLSSENTSNADPKLLVDNDFCTLPVHIPSRTFILTRQERDVAYNMAVNKQLESYFYTDSIPYLINDLYGDQVFYGKPNEILYIDNYIQLPTLEEYFNGLPTVVKVRKRQGEKYFKILGTQTELSEFDPLIMVDQVAIGDISKILAIQPANISRIEIVNELYVKGDQTYGGIINIISKRGDFAGIDLPSSGIFINFSFLSDKDHYSKINPLPNTPDTRNTLFWEPQLVLNKDNTSNVSFSVSDTPGRYQVVLNGVNSKGETYRLSTTFEVIK
jgi:hypothetical protein